MTAQDIWVALNVFSSAALGASFYVLRRTEPYLVNRSFDPKYNGIYVIRFITGIVGGVILAAAIGPTLKDRLGSGPGASLTPAVLAILGGFAVEAVEEVLQRLVDVLLSLVRGDASAQNNAKVVAEQAKKSAQVQADLADLEVKIKAAAPAVAPGVDEALQRIRQTVRRDGSASRT
jgi:outer membrane lipoprotein SlyB